MRDPTELTETEADLVTRLIATYPGALGYAQHREPAVFEIAAELIEEGRVERIEIDNGAAYRLTDGHAEEIRQIASVKADGARLN